MTEIIRERTESREYLILPAPDTDSYEDEMIRRIPDRRVICPETVYRDGKRCRRYAVDGLVSLSELTARKSLDAAKLRDLVIQLESAEGIFREYMLSEANMLLDPDHLFTDRDEVDLRVLAVSGETGDAGSKALMRLLFCSADIGDAETLRLAYAVGRAFMEDDAPLSELFRAVRTALRPERPERAPAAEQPDPEEELFLPEEPEDFDDAAGFYYPGNRTAGPFPEEDGLLPEEPEEELHEKKHPPAFLKNVPIRMIGIALLILTGGLFVIFLFRGAQAVLRVLPQFAIISLSVVIYLVLKAREQEKAPLGEAEN